MNTNPQYVDISGLRIDIKDTEVVLKEAVRRGGLTVRQVERCETLQRAIAEFFCDEAREAVE